MTFALSGQAKTPMEYSEHWSFMDESQQRSILEFIQGIPNQELLERFELVIAGSAKSRNMVARSAKAIELYRIELMRRMAK